MDNDEEITHLVNSLRRLYHEDIRNPFPYKGCFRLRDETGDRFEALIPDLDLYFGDLAGYSDGAKRFLKWDTVKLKEVHNTLQKSFFEKHPMYNELKASITLEHTPDLYAEIALYEEMRTTLLHLLGLLLQRHAEALDTNF